MDNTAHAREDAGMEGLVSPINITVAARDDDGAEQSDGSKGRTRARVSSLSAPPTPRAERPSLDEHHHDEDGGGLAAIAAEPYAQHPSVLTSNPAAAAAGAGGEAVPAPAAAASTSVARAVSFAPDLPDAFVADSNPDLGTDKGDIGIMESIMRGETPYAQPDAISPSETPMAADTKDVPCDLVSEVLILYTGGTIGMKLTKRGFAPAKNYMFEQLQSLRAFRDPTQPPGVTPVTSLGRRIHYTIIEYDPLLDSCNMGYKEWARIARDIHENFDKYDGFVVLHGTDTMAFTASMLSFMLINLSKTVVITGSQIPVSLQRNDAESNLLGALTVAGHFKIPEVTLYFHNKLFRGNRCSKIDASALDAFESNNLPPLMKVGVGFDIRWELVLPASSKPLEIDTRFEPHVGVLTLFPGIEVAMIENMLKPPMKGMVIRTFGAGNAPDQNPEFLRVLKEASDRGVVLVNITQCSKGHVSSHYATGLALRESGVVAGGDMSVEAGLTKLGALLGRGLPPERVRQEMGKAMRGEITEEVHSSQFSLDDSSFILSVYRALHQGSDDPRAQQHMKLIKDALSPVLLCSAAGSGYLGQVKAMVSSGANPSAGDYDGRTPLHLAASEGHADVVKYLLEAGAPVSPVDRWAGTPLHDAIRHGHSEIAEILQAAGAKLESFDRMAGMLAKISAGDVEGLRTLVETSPEDLVCTDLDQRLVTHHAAAAGSVEVMKVLIEAGAPLSAEDRWGYTPISCAMRCGHVDVVKLLIANGCSTSITARQHTDAGAPVRARGRDAARKKPSNRKPAKKQSPTPGASGAPARSQASAMWSVATSAASAAVRTKKGLTKARSSKGLSRFKSREESAVAAYGRPMAVPSGSSRSAAAKVAPASRSPAGDSSLPSMLMNSVLGSHSSRHVSRGGSSAAPSNGGRGSPGGKAPQSSINPGARTRSSPSLRPGSDRGSAAASGLPRLR